MARWLLVEGARTSHFMRGLCWLCVAGVVEGANTLSLATVRNSRESSYTALPHCAPHIAQVTHTCMF